MKKLCREEPRNRRVNLDRQRRDTNYPRGKSYSTLKGIVKRIQLKKQNIEVLIKRNKE